MQGASPASSASPVEAVLESSSQSPGGGSGRRRRSAGPKGDVAAQGQKSCRKGDAALTCAKGDGSSRPPALTDAHAQGIRPQATRLTPPAHAASQPESMNGAINPGVSQSQSRTGSRNARPATDSPGPKKKPVPSRSTSPGPRDVIFGAGVEILARQLAYEYNIGSAVSVLFSYRGTFWPHVLRTHELYLYPLLHTGLVLVQWSWQQQAEEQAGGVDAGRGTFWRTVFEITADEDGLEVGPRQYWEKNNLMIPWKAVGTLTPLMVFALVFFLSQCYSRFMTFFYACQLIETAIQDLTVLMLVHAKKHKHRWDAVRYLTAAAMTTYGRVTDLANVDEDKRRRKPAMDFIDWERLLLPERTWHKQYVSDAETWDTILGWPRPAGLVEEKHTAELHAAFGTSPTLPLRPSSCPALLNADEVDELRHYPDSMVGLVLVTWCVQTLKELELNGQLKGPSLGQAQGSAFKLRAASCKICNLLNLPIPLPYFHTLVVLQNVCFAIMSWSLLSFVSFLTPIVLFFAVLVMVGLREVAVALSNPFGNDDVDFPIDKWVAQLRANALLVHRDNRVVRKPTRADAQTGLSADDDDEEEEEDEDGGAGGGGAGGDAGGGGGGGDDGDDDGGDERGGF